MQPDRRQPEIVRPRRAATPLAACAAVVLSALALALPVAAEPTEGGAFRVYPLRHASIDQVEAPLRQVLAGAAGDLVLDLVLDRDGNRVLVRGSAATQQLAAQLLDSLDRPPAAGRAGGDALLRTYRGGDDLTATAERLAATYAHRADVRIAADARTGQLLVLAPPDVQRRVAAELQSPDRSPVAAPDRAAAPPARRLPPVEAPVRSPFRKRAERAPADHPAPDGEIQLQHLSGEALHRRLEQLLKRPLPRTHGADRNQVHFPLAAAPGARVDVQLDLAAGRLQLVGPAAQVRSWSRVIAALDSAPAAAARQTAVVSMGGARPDAVRKAVTAVQAAARGGNERLVTMLFQPRSDEESQPAPQPGGPAAARPDAGGAAAPETGALLGPVQIELLEGLDVIVVRGSQRDVARVLALIEQIERLSAVTEPAIEVYPLQHVGSTATGELVRQLYDQVLAARQGTVSITPLVKPNALLLIGRRENVDSVIELVGKLDQPVDPETEFRTFPLKHAAANEAKATIDEFFEERAGLGTRAVITADFRSNALVVQASPRDMAEVEALVARLDTPTSAAVNVLKVFQLENALADELAPIMQEAIQSQAEAAAGGDDPNAARARSTMLRLMTIDAEGQQRLDSGILTDVRITADPRANALIVSAPAESMGLIEAVVRQLDQLPTAEAQIKVFTIANGDATGLAEMLDVLFGDEQAATAAAGEGVVPLRFSVEQRTNSIIASGSSEDLAVVEAILLRLDDSDVRQRESTVYRLQNAPAVDVANAVNELLRSERQLEQTAPGLVSPFEQIEREVVVVPEPVSNSLIVSATPRYFEEIRKLVEQLDERPPMVMIQVMIAEVALNDTDEFGVELGLQDSLLFDRSILGDLLTTVESVTETSPGGAVTTTENETIQSATITPGFNFNNQPLGNSGSDQALANSGNVGGQGLTNFALGRINNELGFGGLVLSASSESVSVLLRALQETRHVEVLSRPQVMTLDNQPAFIQVGQRVPRVTGTTINETGQVNTVQLENVGLILGVTPRISPDGLVVMEIDAERSEVGPESEGIPISISTTGQVLRSPRVNTITAQTTVSALSGQTIVLGGLITKNLTDIHRRAPYLSEIPIIGDFFRYDSVVDRRTELLIVMTPRVVRNQDDAEMIKQVETCRMNWCLSDVVSLHGPLDTVPDADGVEVIYPDLQPGAEDLQPPIEELRTAPANGAAPAAPLPVPSSRPVPIPGPAARTNRLRLAPRQASAERPGAGQGAQSNSGVVRAEYEQIEGSTERVERAVYEESTEPAAPRRRLWRRPLWLPGTK